MRPAAIQFICLCVTLSLMASPTRAAQFAGGTGTADDPYQIATPEQLMSIGADTWPLTRHFILTADIDLDPDLPGGRVFEAAVIAPDTDPAMESFQGVPFRGAFDGNGHKISHMTIQGAGYLGLFGALANGDVCNLGMVDVDVTGSGSCVGALAGSTSAALRRGSIVQCYSTGKVSGDSTVGGLVGEDGQMLISQCCSSARVIGLREDIGGLVGANAASISDCYATGMVVGDVNVGGLVGRNGRVENWSGASLDGKVARCYSAGIVIIARSSAGGLVGQNGDYCTVTHCFWDVTTSGQITSAGGTGLTTAEMQMLDTFLGWGSCGPVWTIDEGKDYPRLAWQNAPGDIIPAPTYGGGMGTAEDPYLIYTARQLDIIGQSRCDWDKHFRLMADVDLSAFDGKEGRPAFHTIATDYYDPFTGVFDGMGHAVSHLTLQDAQADNVGLFGLMGQGSEVSDLVIQDANVQGDCYVGPLVAYCTDGTVRNCRATGTVRGRQYTGGLVGIATGKSLTQCCHSESHVVGRSETGGLVGANSSSTILRCSASGIVEGCGESGGITGRQDGNSLIQDSYSTCLISGPHPVTTGGIVGRNYNSLVSRCYAAGPIADGNTVGGLVGSSESGTVEASFWDIESSGQAGSAGGTGKTTAEMQTASTYLSEDWDFVGESRNGIEDIWCIDEGNDYPRFWQGGSQPWAFSPDPRNGATNVARSPTLTWVAAPTALYHDVYIGDTAEAVANATPESTGIYRGRQQAEATTYSLDGLDWGKTYYWRVDEVNENEPNSPWQGELWRFTTVYVTTSPNPADGALYVGLHPTLAWAAAMAGLLCDVYFGNDESAVANASRESPGVYRGRPPVDVNTYEPGDLNPGTYYWRIDAIDQADPNRLWKGEVWTFHASPPMKR
jgi:hypothetical protein